MLYTKVKKCRPKEEASTIKRLDRKEDDIHLIETHNFFKMHILLAYTSCTFD